jgi:hypothetical protein
VTTLQINARRKRNLSELPCTAFIYIRGTARNIHLITSLPNPTHPNPKHSHSQHAYLLLHPILYLLIFSYSFPIPLQMYLLNLLFCKKENVIQPPTETKFVPTYYYLYTGNVFSLLDFRCGTNRTHCTVSNLNFFKFKRICISHWIARRRGASSLGPAESPWEHGSVDATRDRNEEIKKKQIDNC